MHATATASRTINPAFIAASNVRPGQHFVQQVSPSEVLVPLSYAGAPTSGDEYTWAVVVAVNPESQGYIPGQLVKLKRSALVRPVREARGPVFALEQ
ncbi:hypothetical protein [Pinirhizobacter sp.]|jgi:hypothetical protein|uniref:hypothetical protein n=1 Tax=Pinirhizobacter sp. TaxID=2950432 RepID=UPI002F405395